MKLKMFYYPETYFSEIEMQVIHNPLCGMTISDSNLASLSRFVFPLLEISIMFSSKRWLKSYLGSLQRICSECWYCTNSHYLRCVLAVLSQNLAINSTSKPFDEKTWTLLYLLLLPSFYISKLNCTCEHLAHCTINWNKV